ncbi:MAG: hypothetical protein LBS36_03005 [Oscillospiraceae bacterium]|jgi:hypothetical protein|nr:hypothetical protein [Oscillospiraceae bacterium]
MMDTTPRVELSDKQVEQLAFALYPSAMDFCKKAMDNSKNKKKECQSDDKEKKDKS